MDSSSTQRDLSTHALSSLSKFHQGCFNISASHWITMPHTVAPRVTIFFTSQIGLRGPRGPRLSTVRKQRGVAVLSDTMAIGQSSRSLSRCLRRLMHVNDPFFLGRGRWLCVVTMSTRFLLITLTKLREAFTQHLPQRMTVRRRPVAMSTIALR